MIYNILRYDISAIQILLNYNPTVPCSILNCTFVLLEITQQAVELQRVTKFREINGKREEHMMYYFEKNSKA